MQNFRNLKIAMGSARDLEYHFILAHDPSYLSDQDYQILDAGVSEIKQMLAAFIQKLRSRQPALKADS